VAVARQRSQNLGIGDHMKLMVDRRVWCRASPGWMSRSQLLDLTPLLFEQLRLRLDRPHQRLNRRLNGRLCGD